MKKTQEQFVEKATIVHNGKYIYNHFIYVNAKTKSMITCPVHGNFEQRPDAHLAGRGCPKCAGKEKKTKEEFVINARKIHGTKYDYSKFEYLGSLNKSTIICPQHGEFEQRPNAHLSGKGCPKCSKSYPKSQSMFIEKANEIHQNKYSYGHFIYSGALEKGIITCPEHGDFEQRADAHLRGVGCPQCAKNRRKKTTKQFIKEAQQVHGKLYDYSQFIYTNVRTKGIIICAQHGEFEQLPSNHLSGNGCPKCAAEKKGSTRRSHCKSKHYSASISLL
ncbi:hypothetical protein [Photobacterium damselae]|uniref:hypothetical protein n=1 Tax=Photobacterium damselae TaxID=38293 RepID=UPI0040679E43